MPADIRSAQLHHLRALLKLRHGEYMRLRAELGNLVLIPASQTVIPQESIRAERRELFGQLNRARGALKRTATETLKFLKAA